MKSLRKIHHVAIICSDYQKSKLFYTRVLGLEIINETYRKERGSYKLDLSLKGQYIIELFSFPDPPSRVTNPEAAGLRHLSFEVENLENVIQDLEKKNVQAELIRKDEITGKRFTFIRDPDDLPIELYEE